MLKNLLESPYFYQKFQEVGGFFGARVRGLAEFIDLKPSMRVLDIGCGPGYILAHLPKNVEYVGYDIDATYIDHAKREFGSRGSFFCGYFDAKEAEALAPMDVVMMNGVLHHISDDELVRTLDAVRRVLRVGGILFTLDGCYREGQSIFRKWMLDNDRGRFIRNEAGYRAVLENAFEDVALHIRENYSRVPYSFAIGISQKRDDGSEPRSRHAGSL
jgi:SAM-dependent methyltransferase